MKLALLIALVLPAGTDEWIDLGPLLRTVPDRRAPVLGPAPLRSGGWQSEEEDPAEEDFRVALFHRLQRAGAPRSPFREPGRILGGRWVRVPAEEGDAVRAAIRRLLADPGRSIAIGIEITGPDGDTWTGETAARSGRWTVAGRIGFRRFLADNDVEIACSGWEEAEPSIIVDPMVRTARDGVAIDVRPTVVENGEGVLLEAVVQVGRFEPEPSELDLAARGHGRIELPRYRGSRIELSGRVVPGGTLVAGYAGPHGETTVKLTPRPAGAALETLLDTVGPVGSRTVRLELRTVDRGEEIGRIDLPATAGRTSLVRVGRDEMVVSDWDVEVGCYNQIGDPDVKPVFSGELLRVTPSFSPDGRAVCLELEMESRETIVSPPPPSGMEVTGAIHPVSARRRPLHAELILRGDEPIRLSLGPGRTLMVRARGLLSAGAAPK